MCIRDRAKSLRVQGHPDTSVKLIIDIMLESQRELKKDPTATAIPFSVFSQVFRAYSAFRACDYDMSDELTISELKNLLYLYEGDEPPQYRVDGEVKELHKQGGDTISLSEWMNYLCHSSDGTTKVLNDDLWKMFKKFDKDKSGTLTVLEVKELLKEVLRNRVKVSVTLDKDFEGIIQGLAEDVMKELDQDNKDDHMVDDSKRSLTWSEFKTFIQKTTSMQEKLVKFLNEYS
eukprot:TRINITY_DN8047_c0_g1_i1.p1 TRINITY_DN8047_c0_g1~~TRINITY_DN8047_c0_g1_i1.p1  ORF type:complete len:251 (+),score=69.63 TRINITY_DN8047_c0_g1_i1:60-755(+)